MRPPDFFIAGHEKCGTTALYEMLRPHPQVFLPELKEPHFLNDDRRPRFPPELGRALPQTMEEYLALFAGARRDQLVGEASASYMWSHTAAANIAALQPAAKVVAIVREPASFLHSLHLQLQRAHFESEKDLRKAIALEDERREGRHIPRRCPYPAILQYSDHVAYADQLHRYLDVLPQEQLLMLIYDDFRADNEGTVRQVLRFLGLDDSLEVEVTQANVTKRTVRSQGLDEMITSVALGSGPLSGTLKTLAPRRLRRGAARALRRRVVLAEPPPLDERLTLELRRRYRDEVVALSGHLGRDLVALWGYDAL
jgi:Sulfotransferase family